MRTRGRLVVDGFGVVAVVAMFAACCCDPCRRTCCPSPCAPCGASAAAQASLFDRLGGMKGVEALIDDFLPRITTDPRVMGNKVVGERMKATDPKVVRQRFLDFLCHIAGGPCKYEGRDMKSSHKGLGITKAEWDAGGQDFMAALVSKYVGETEKNLREEVMARVGAFEKDIVEKP